MIILFEIFNHLRENRKMQTFGMSQTLNNAYLDYMNNYLTVDKYSEHNNMSVEQGESFIKLARQVHIELWNGINYENTGE
jgi:hypothetical protein